jgi:hypothetical protein
MVVWFTREVGKLVPRAAPAPAAIVVVPFKEDMDTGPSQVGALGKVAVSEVPLKIANPSHPVMVELTV